MAKVAVVGGGLSGWSCAYALRSLTAQVHVFDMGARGPGGRATTRRQEGFQFDHGLSFVPPVTDSRCAQLVTEMQAAGVLQEWTAPVSVVPFGDAGPSRPAERSSPAAGSGQNDGRFFGALRGPLLCGVPAADALVQHLGAVSGAQSHQGTRVSGMRQVQGPGRGQWSLSGVTGVGKDSGKRGEEEELGNFDAVVLADSGVFLAGSAGEIPFESGGCMDATAREMSPLERSPTFALMLAFPRPLDLTPGLYLLPGNPTLMSLACDSSKPGRERSDGQQCWVALASTELAQSILDDKPLTVDGQYNPQTHDYLRSIAPKLQGHVQELMQQLGSTAVEPSFVALQRWGAGLVKRPVGKKSIGIDAHHVVACGDFCLGGGFENCVVSGFAAADRVQQWKLQ